MNKIRERNTLLVILIGIKPLDTILYEKTIYSSIALTEFLALEITPF